MLSQPCSKQLFRPAASRRAPEDKAAATRDLARGGSSSPGPSPYTATTRHMTVDRSNPKTYPALTLYS